jgi:transglutaminase-like putative cysteine protease
MGLIPPSSFRLLKWVLLRVGCLCLGATSCFAQASFLTVASTPYDRQMTPIARVLNASAGALAGRTSLASLNQWLTSLRAIPYQYSLQWKTPAQVNSDLVADCKGKAILLYAIMRANGATHIRFVIGKHHVADQRTHAWLEWDTTSGTYLLDPTFNRAVERVNDYDPAMYIPHFAYNGARKYRATYHHHSYASIVASN